MHKRSISKCQADVVINYHFRTFRISRFIPFNTVFVPHGGTETSAINHQGQQYTTSFWYKKPQYTAK